MHPRVAPLFESEFEAMTRLARAMLTETSDVEDVVMDAFLATAERIDSLDRPGGYLRMAVINGCRQRLRDRGRRRRILAERVAPGMHRDRLPPAEQAVEMVDLLDSLSERERTAIVMTYYLDLPHADTASILGCSVGTVKSLVHRAKRSLREVMSI